MSVRDPFLRALLIVIDRVIVFLVLCALMCALLWELICTRALDMSALDSLQSVLAIVRGAGSPVNVVTFGLTATVSVLSSVIISAVLFVAWRRRAHVDSTHVRGPLSEGWQR